MRRCMVLAVALVLAACSSDSLTAPRDIPEPRSALGSSELDSYDTAPCAPGIADNINSWRSTVGDPTAIVTGTSGDTSFVRVEFRAPAGYESYYDGVVWQEYWYLPGWTYCMATRSVGLPNPYER